MLEAFISVGSVMVCANAGRRVEHASVNPERQKAAQARADRIAAFRAELCQLEQERELLLTPEQRSGLEAHLDRVVTDLTRHFGVDVSESARRISWGMRLATLLGGTAFGTAVVLFLHRIWGVLPAFAYPLILTASPLALLAATGFAARRGVARYYLSLLAMAAGVGFALELNGLGSTLNQIPSPHMLLAWAALALLVAYACGIRLLLGAGLVVLCAYTAALWTNRAGGYWVTFVERADYLIPSAAALYAVPWLKAHREPSDFDFVYRFCGGALLLLSLMILSKTGDPCCSVVPGRALEPVCQIAGLGLSVGVVFHGLRLGRGGLVNLGAVGFVVFLFVRLHAWWWHWMPKYLFFFILGAIAFLLLLVFRRMRTQLSERASE